MNKICLWEYHPKTLKSESYIKTECKKNIECIKVKMAIEGKIKYCPGCGKRVKTILNFT